MREAWFGIRRSTLTAAALLLLLAAWPLRGADGLTAHQQLVKARQDWISAGMPGTRETPGGAPKFGTTSETTVAVQAYAFQSGISNDQLLDDGNGYRYYGAPTADPYIAAPLQLPSGVMIDSIALSGCAVSPGDLVVGLYDNQWGGQANVLIGTDTFGIGGACGLSSQGVSYLYGQSSQHPLYLVIYFANNPLNGSVKFNEVEISYHRVVSAAPATSDFGDVPTSSPQFQFIEALYAAGITVGCGGGNYCPNQALTRGQMAVYLAKALGLHWPN